MMQGNFKADVEFLIDCYGCSGRGVPIYNGRVAERVCVVCNGSGKLYTDEGSNLAQFLWHYYGLKPRASVPATSNAKEEAGAGDLVECPLKVD